MSALNSDLIDSLLEDLSDLATPTRGVEGYEEAYRRLRHLIAGGVFALIHMSTGG